jgi:hypothetical protein
VIWSTSLFEFHFCIIIWISIDWLGEWFSTPPTKKCTYCGPLGAFLRFSSPKASSWGWWEPSPNPTTTQRVCVCVSVCAHITTPKTKRKAHSLLSSGQLWSELCSTLCAAAVPFDLFLWLPFEKFRNVATRKMPSCSIYNSKWQWRRN